MKKQIISYRLQICLAMIPFVGAIIVWIIAWLNIYRVTKNRLFIFLHYLIWLIPVMFLTLVISLIYYCFIFDIGSLALIIALFMTIGYFVLVIWALSGIGIEKGIIERYKKYKIKRIENNLE